jgi:hypothetical protein
MRLHLITSDAREITADIQFVKHFDGLIGGAEAALDNAIRGGLQQTLFDLESNRFLNSRLVEVPVRAPIGSRNLLVLNLGEIGKFTLGYLEGAISHAMGEVLKFGFKTVATPVIGISDHAGLPIERAYRTLLQAILSKLFDHTFRTDSMPSIEHIIIFDKDKEKVDFFKELTPDIFTELEVTSRQPRDDEYEILLERPVRNVSAIVSQAKVIPFAQSQTDKSEVVIGGMITRPDVVKVLFLAANPTDTRQLRLDEEIREIDIAFRQAEYRNRFDIRQHWAVRVIDLQSHILRHEPNIVHFSGHGRSSSQIILENALGESQPVSPRALSQLFSVLHENIRCVVLNACYSEQQAQAIAEHIECVVGMSSVNSRPKCTTHDRVVCTTHVHGMCTAGFGVNDPLGWVWQADKVRVALWAEQTR